MINSLRICIFILWLTPMLSAQESVSWFPYKLNIQPFTANFLEPKAGFNFAISESNLRLDVGTSTDFFQFKDGDNIFSAGADLFTYTRLRQESDFHFPVETIDYLFGVNFGFVKNSGCYSYGLRFRLSHISAHLVDGSFDSGKNDWRESRDPLVYSREFIEVFPFYEMDRLRGYLGITFIFHSTPRGFGKGIYQAGFDYFPDLLKIEKISPFIAYDFKLSKIEKYSANHIIAAGIKFGEFDAKGFSLIYSYIAGKSIHGEYFNLNENYSTIGFNLDL